MILDALMLPRPYFHVDDVLISGILAERADVPRECLETIGYAKDFGDVRRCFNPPLLAIFQLKRYEIQRVLKSVKQGIVKC